MTRTITVEKIHSILVNTKTILSFFALIGTIFLFSQASFAENKSLFGFGTHQYQVTITNITAHQTFTPILVASHQTNVHLFTFGDSASEELENLAESGNPQPLADLLEGIGVRDVKTADAPLPPGQSLTFTLSARAVIDEISVAAMLVPTNDAFFALNGVDVPVGNFTKTYYALAYDAGTEFNDEDCDNIPGPPTVCTGEGFNLSRENAEGFVHIHRGIHGSGDLSAARYDWRNPVAKITVSRVHH